MQWENFFGIIYILVGIYGLLIGSFLNVCIYRLPKGEGIVKGRSHCMSCKESIAWYDLIPVVSWLCLGGRCRKCHTKISYQYPLMEAANGLLYVIIFHKYGVTVTAFLYALTASALLVLSIIDWRTFEIPDLLSGTILLLGSIRVLTDLRHFKLYIIGFFSVSIVLLLLYIFTNGRAIGGGDVKLMAAIGLLLGWKQTLFAFIAGCILGSFIHSFRIKVFKVGNQLAFGPYLAAGSFLSMLYGEEIIGWYMHTFLYI